MKTVFVINQADFPKLTMSHGESSQSKKRPRLMEATLMASGCHVTVSGNVPLYFNFLPLLCQCVSYHFLCNQSLSSYPFTSFF